MLAAGVIAVDDLADKIASSRRSFGAHGGRNGDCADWTICVPGMILRPESANSNASLPSEGRPTQLLSGPAFVA
jgi:hypothetical protein